MQIAYTPPPVIKRLMIGGALVAWGTMALVLSGTLSGSVDVCRADSAPRSGEASFVVESISWHDEQNYRKVLVGQIDSVSNYFEYSREKISSPVVVAGRIAVLVGDRETTVGDTVYVNFANQNIRLKSFNRSFGDVHRTIFYESANPFNGLKQGSNIRSACSSSGRPVSPRPGRRRGRSRG